MTLKVGRVVLNEAAMRPFEETWSTDGRTVTLSGVWYSDHTRSVARMASLHDDILGLPESLVPVTFDTKSHRNAYYRVTDSSSSLIQLPNEPVIMLTWEIGLTRAGSDSEIDLETRLAGASFRLNDHGINVGTVDRWHAPPIGHSAFYAGSATPGQVIRTGAEGNVVVYRTLSTTLPSVSWHCPVESYGSGRVRLFDAEERFGTGIDLDNDSWELNNSLLSVEPFNGGIRVSVHDGSSWSTAKSYNLTADNVALGIPKSVSVIHHEFERITLRCLWNRNPSGRITCDLTLRRGSRFVELLMKSHASATLGVVRSSNEAAFSGSGFIRATSNDANGDRYVIGSSKSFTSNLTAGGISKASVTRFDAFVGAEINGSAAVTGDQAANLLSQYLGSPSETVVAVKR